MAKREKPADKKPVVREPSQSREDIAANRFLFSVAMAKRARQLKEGARPLITLTKDEEHPPILVALEEYRQHKLDIFIRDKSEPTEELIEEMSEFLEDDVPTAVEEAPEVKEVKPVKAKMPKPKSKSLVA